MTKERRRRVQQVFDEARLKAPGDRAAFIARTCGDDAELRAEVESLLTHDERAAEGFLRPPEPPAGVRRVALPEGPDPRVGGTIGSYRIKSVIASGGMGTVYLAEQAHPRRDVALKVMRAGISSRSALKRFEYESQILARLQHPNIAHVYEAGTHADDAQRVPYFAMEYVPDAETITDYAIRKKLGTRERLELFAQVCDAVHHGHQKGVVHRDLKPGNILVNSSGQVKVIDFGVARSTDSDVALTTMRTDVGQLIGTLQYMSPEQCDADPHEIDTRSDVYSLGVVLYELLTGRLPYDVSHLTIHSAARTICEQPPAKPSTFDRRLRGDVETIVLKALEKDRQKRYPSAAGMAEDIRRYLNGEPITARPPTAWTKTVRWVTRHPAVTTAAACVGMAAVIVAASCVAIWLLNFQPYNIVLYRDGHLVRPRDHGPADEARLLSFGGRSLHTWGGAPGAIMFGDLVERPAEFGGGKLALIGYRGHSASRFPGSLCAYDVSGDLETPIWRRRIETDDVLEELERNRGFTGEQFGIYQGLIANVFPGPARPGDEVVAMFSHFSSKRVIRIYDLAGRLLYQVWHDGEVRTAHWMADAGLLVFAGENARVKWDPYGNALEPGRDPVVVFALRPRPDHIGHDWLPDEAGDDPLSPVWYKWLRLRGRDTAMTRDDIEWCKVTPPRDNDPGRFVGLDVYVDSELGAGVGWTLDEFGEEVHNSRVVGDAYKHNQVLPDGDPQKRRLPDPNDFYLGDKPLSPQAGGVSSPAAVGVR